MDETAGLNILYEYKKLLALNSSLEARLDDYANIIKSRDHEIEMLQGMLTDSSAYRSSLDSQVDQLNELNNNIIELQQQVQAGSYIGTSRHLQVGSTVSTEQQFENLKLQYTYLQTQLTDLQHQLETANQRNLQLQQQSGRFAELESLLENMEEEIRQLKEERR